MLKQSAIRGERRRRRFPSGEGMEAEHREEALTVDVEAEHREEVSVVGAGCWKGEGPKIRA